MLFFLFAPMKATTIAHASYNKSMVNKHPFTLLLFLIGTYSSFEGFLRLSLRIILAAAKAIFFKFLRERLIQGVPNHVQINDCSIYKYCYVVLLERKFTTDFRLLIF